MNGMDRNQAIGLVLISAMLIIYFTFFSAPPQQEKRITADTLNVTSVDSNKVVKSLDTAALKQQYGSFASAVSGIEQEQVLENDELKITFSNKGGVIKHVLLKNFQTYTKQPLYVIASDYHKFELSIPAGSGVTNISELFYSSSLNVSADKKSLTFRLAISPEKYIEHVYSLNNKGFELQYNIVAKGFENEFKGKQASINWLEQFQNTEKDVVEARKTANVTYRTFETGFHSLSETKTELQEEKIENKINWVVFKQKFFSAGLIADNGFTGGTVTSSVDVASTTTVKNFSASLGFPAENLQNGKSSFKFYFGPNKLGIVKGVAPDFDENVYLGWPVINTINRYTIAPLFSLLEKVFSNYGIIIIFMVLIIKLILLPLSFQSYKSMAKIKVLKPEIDEIKARVGDDMTAMQQEQMKLYQQVGVSPLSGCIPVLLQMPVLLAMFNFFPNAIDLRQKSFLWAEDLSTYDSVFNLPFTIPFYGDHVSLFTLLMTASTILYTWYNNQTNVSATGPMIAMSYIMPVVFLFVLNSFPAGLSFYYFVSNMITIGQQFVIKLFVDEKEIREKLDHNKKNFANKKPNRFQQRLMEAMEQQKEMKKKQTKK